MATDFLNGIAGYKVLKSWLGTVTKSRQILKIGGLPISDNGSETVLNGVQTITGSGTWDGFSGVVLVKGSGARLIAIPDPTDLAEGVTVKFVDAAGNSGAGTITLDPSGGGTIAGAATQTITTNGTSRSIVFISAGVWQLG